MRVTSAADQPLAPVTASVGAASAAIARQDLMPTRHRDALASGYVFATRLFGFGDLGDLIETARPGRIRGPVGTTATVKGYV